MLTTRDDGDQMSDKNRASVSCSMDQPITEPAQSTSIEVEQAERIKRHIRKMLEAMRSIGSSPPP